MKLSYLIVRNEFKNQKLQTEVDTHSFAAQAVLGVQQKKSLSKTTKNELRSTKKA